MCISYMAYFGSEDDNDEDEEAQLLCMTGETVASLEIRASPFSLMDTGQSDSVLRISDYIRYHPMGRRIQPLVLCPNGYT